MKRLFCVSAICMGVMASAQAVEFNTDALKSMQEEGHKIVAESQAARSYKAANGQCLDFKGNQLRLANCDGDKRSQQWKLDAKQRLVAHNGRCIAGSNLQECGDVKAQKWTLDDRQRLINKVRKCLQPKSKPAKAGGIVVAGNCNKSVHLVWE